MARALLAASSAHFIEESGHITAELLIGPEPVARASRLFPGPNEVGAVVDEQGFRPVPDKAKASQSLLAQLDLVGTVAQWPTR